MDRQYEGVYQSDEESAITSFPTTAGLNGPTLNSPTEMGYWVSLTEAVNNRERQLLEDVDKDCAQLNP